MLVINPHVSTLARPLLTHHQAGNLRLLMNANLYSSMPVQKMAGNGGVTFACINAVSPQDPQVGWAPACAALGPGPDPDLDHEDSR